MATGGAGPAAGTGGATTPAEESSLDFHGSITFLREQP